MTQINDILRPLTLIENHLGQIAQLAETLSTESEKLGFSAFSEFSLLVSTEINKAKTDLGALYLLTKTLKHEPQYLGGENDIDRANQTANYA